MRRRGFRARGQGSGNIRVRVRLVRTENSVKELGGEKVYEVENERRTGGADSGAVAHADCPLNEGDSKWFGFGMLHKTHSLLGYHTG